MAFLRFSRDKRGYELFALVQPEQQSKPRVLYAFRTPPNIKVGREPFDEDARRALEAAYPHAGFNWRQIAETPIPSADADAWRERRRAIKEAKLAARREETEQSQPADSASARRRRRRRGRGRPLPETAAAVSSQEDASSEARSGSQPSEEGSEIPEMPDTTGEPGSSS